MTEQEPGTPVPPDQPTETGSTPPPADTSASPLDNPPAAAADESAADASASPAWSEPSIEPASAPPPASPPPVAAAPTPAPAAPSASMDRRGVIAIGAALILFGAFFLVVQALGTDFADLGWPLFVVAPGVILYVIGFIAGGRNGVGFAVAGSVIAAVGLVLAWQNATDMWASWAYAWALVGPFAAGFGMLTYGLAYRYDDLISQGISALGVGAALFLLGFFFFEGVLGLSGEPMPVARDLFPYAAIVLGAALIVLSLFTGARRSKAA